MKILKKKNALKAPWASRYNKKAMDLKYPDCSLYQLIAETALKYPNNIALQYFDTTITYKKLMQQIDVCTRAFASIGIGTGDVVTICMPSTPESIIAFYSLNKMGAVANMIHPLSGENEIKHYLEVSNSKMIITINIAWTKILNILDDVNIKNVVIISPNNSMNPILKLGYEVTIGRKIAKPERYSSFVMNWNTFISKGKNSNEDINAHTKSSDYAAILYSGGTTGDPKGIVLSNKAFNSMALSASTVIGNAITEKDSTLAILPIFHGFGLGVCVHTVLSIGAKSILIPQFDPKSFDKYLKNYRPSLIIGVPTLYEALLKNKKVDKLDLSFAKLLVSGGDSLSINLKARVDKFMADHGSEATIKQGYGLTECTAAVCLEPFDESRSGSIGIPLPNVYIKIVEPKTHNEVPYGTDGEIVVYSPTMMSGYLNDEIETNKRMQLHADGKVWVHTGDMGCMDEDGFVYFKQRIKRMLVSSGYNVYPQYIENVIDGHPSVMMSTVIGIDDAYKGQVAKAFVILKEGVRPGRAVKDSILKHCKKNLPIYSLPKEIEFRESLPKTLVGKIAYKKLMEEDKAGKKQ